MNEPTAWIVYHPDWSGIEIYFDELAAYKAAVSQHADVVQVGAGDIKEQAKNPRTFNQPNQENNNGNERTVNQNDERRTIQPTVSDERPGNGGAQSRPKEKGGAQIVDQDAALKEAQREAAARSRATDGEGASFIR